MVIGRAELGDTTTHVDRETLYNEVWSEPVSVVAPRYGLSDVGLAKICRSLAIPLPSRGYWAKVQAGRIMARTPLPKLKQPGPVSTRLVKLPPEKAAVREAVRRAAARARKETEQAVIEDSPTSPHPLVEATSKRLRQRDGWDKDALVRAAPKEVLNLSVTLNELDRALGVVDALLKALSKQGFDCEVNIERGATLLRWRETGTTLELALTEHIRRSDHQITPAEERAKKRYWDRNRWDTAISFPHVPRYDYTPTGVLTLQVGRWPSRSWKDTPRTKLEKRIGEVTSGILVLAKETHEKEMEEARREEVHRLAVERYEFLTRRRDKEIERFKKLELSANCRERAAKLRVFATAVEESARSNGTLTAEKIEWLAWARAKADWLDPLVELSDVILDAPEPKKPNYW